MSAYFKGFGPSHLVITRREHLRGSLGALMAVGITALCSAVSAGILGDGVPLLAPIGASAVLVFVLPASPLAQPWSVIVGNTLSALIGVAVARLIPSLILAEAIAVSGAIAAMILCRCLHPPGGAVALTAVIGTPAIQAMGYHFAFGPIFLGSLVMIAIALLYHPLTGVPYPHRPLAVAPKAAPQEVTSDDVKHALEKHRETIDIDPDDLASLVLEAELESKQRESGKAPSQ